MTTPPPPPPPSTPNAATQPVFAPPQPTSPPVPQTLIEVDSVSKWFGDLVAVSDVSFSVGPGVTALLGPNGAGKSTMLRMMCGLAAPSSGTVRVLGRDPKTDVSVMRYIGLAPQQEGVFEYLTALEFVTLNAELHGLANARDAAAHALRVVELDPADSRRLPTYSKGMRQRVKLAQAIVHQPSIVMLDEPLSGLDPRQRVQMVELFHQMGDEGRCVIVSSHVLEEVERFGSNVLVIAQGRLAAQGDFRAIRELMDDRPRQVKVDTDQPLALAGALLAQGFVSGVRVVDTTSLVLDTGDIKAFSRALAPLAQQADARIFSIRPTDDGLESVFKYLVSRR